MKKSRKKPIGFSKTRKEINEKNHAKELLQENQAIECIKQGELKEAATIYHSLINQGTKNHIVYGNLAVIYGRENNKKDMIKLLKKALEIKPDFADALNNLGNAQKEQGDLSAAIDSYQKAIKSQPNFTHAHFNLANTLKDEGEVTNAIDSYQKAIQLKPNFPEAYSNLGNALKENNDLNTAIDSYQKAIQLKPNFPEAYNNLGHTLQVQDRFVEAIQAYQKALQFKPDFPEALTNLGTLLHQQGKRIEAHNLFKNALKLNPKSYDTHFTLANIQYKERDINSAIKSYKKVIQFNPDFADGHNNLGNALKEKGDLSAAIDSYQKAIQLRPNFPEAYSNLGTALQQKGDLYAAIDSFKLAIKLNPFYPEAHYNLGNVLKDLGHFNDAIDSLEQALKLKPQFPDAKYTLGHILLLTGQYKKGWRNYEYRSKKIKPTIPHAKPQTLKWQGESLKDKEQLLIVSEQGLGDTVQFMRYIPYLRWKGLDVLFCAQDKLHSLIKESKIDSNPLTQTQANLFSNGKWLSLLSLPNYINIYPQDQIIPKAYITTNETLTNKWKKILSQEKKPIIGINWQGNPDTEQHNLRGRSLSLETFSIITKHNNIKLLSLQKGFGSEQLEHCSFIEKFVNSQMEINNTWDFSETASIIANCDLVITSDTSVAHISGGMNKPTWLLLQKIPDWRWGLEGNETSWYPSMRLFRQNKRNDWHEVMERVSIELERIIGTQI